MRHVVIIAASRRRSVARLDVVVLDDLGPARDLLVDEGIELVWGTGEHVDSLRRQLVRNLGCLDGLGELVVDTLGESRGHVGRTEYSPPRVNLEAGHTLARNRLGARELGIGRSEARRVGKGLRV